MKSTIAFCSVALVLLLAGCGAPATPVDEAAKYDLTPEEYQQMKEMAARMGMSLEDHLGHMLGE